MAKIGDETVGATLINVFDVDPENQQQLLDEIQETVESMSEIPGFVSLSLHRSLDGERVVNYVQFENREAFQAVHNSPTGKNRWERRWPLPNQIHTFTSSCSQTKRRTSTAARPFDFTFPHQDNHLLSDKNS
ncbi:antibiotic biosynthesis monooxygenase family protein [Haladaptatus pallidirubidus]|uniref:ABM domain-containing protein n=1 Tax=Haladaptatus pallidirubidus TaxID=1008152 RepID=A0AAV3UQK0_9EURY